MALFGFNKGKAKGKSAERVAETIAVESSKSKKPLAFKGSVAVAAKADKKVAPAPIKVPTVISSHVDISASSAIIRPHITEKSGLLSQGGVYTFQITAGANKDNVAKAIKTLYKVTPVKVAITNNPAKRVFVRGKRGRVPGVRKAVVTVKKGDKIDFV
jgi:large subunit ribosomal protein L23